MIVTALKKQKVNQDIQIRKILITLFFFVLAGLSEIGGGYLVWLWLREDMSWILGAIGGFILFLYGIVPTFQPSYFIESMLLMVGYLLSWNCFGV
jgi:drug/metabolite transporter superfamily protein YnfA